MNIQEMKDILSDTELVSPLEDCSELGIIINIIKIKKYKVIIYGGGVYGELTVKYLSKYRIDVEYIIDADSAKCGSYIENIKVIDLFGAKKIFNNYTEKYIAFISMNKKLYEQCCKDVENFLNKIGVKGYYFEEIWSRVRVSNYVKNPLQYTNDFLYVYNLLMDTESKNTLLEFIRCFLKNDSWILPEHMCSDKYWGCDFEGKDELYTHLEHETWLNCGSCMGDTIFNYLGKGYKFEKIYAIEGDDKNFLKLQKNIELLEELKENIELIHRYVGEEDECLNIEVFFKNKKITLMNADIEGLEMDVLIAAKEIIIEQKPVIAFCTYHHFEDVIKFVKYLNALQVGYHFYLRKYVSGVYSRFRNETVLYAIPANRLL